MKNSGIDDLYYKKDKFVLTKYRVIYYFKENGKVLVLDYFNYAPEDI